MNNPIQVWPDKYQLRVKQLNGPHIDKNGHAFQPCVGQFQLPLAEALNKSYDTDAHMTLYSFQEADGTVHPACPFFEKHVIKQIHAEGCELLQNAVCLDWDTPGHVALTPEHLNDILGKFIAAGVADERLAQWRAYHTTRHGMRFLYEYEEAVPAMESEQRVTAMIKEFKRHDLNMDPVSKNWSFCFRLPKVKRDNLATEDEPMFIMQIQDKYLDVRQFKKLDLKALAVTAEFHRAVSSPHHEECHSILYEDNPSTGREVQSRFHKAARTAIRQTPFFDRIFGSAPLAGDTGRNEAFQTVIGVVVPLLVNKLRASAEEIFALFSGPLESLELLAGKQNPRDHFWNFLQDVYAREHAAFMEREQIKADAVEEGQTTLERMVEGMKQWCSAPELFCDDNLVREAFVKSHIFANVTKFYYPMNEDGWYSSLCLSRDQLVPRVRKSYLKNIIETERQDLKGNTVSVSAMEISNTHSTVVNEVRMSPLQGAHGRIDDIDGDAPILTLPMYQRNDFLPAEHNAAVDGWLKALFGKGYQQAVRWIGYALAFEDGPISVLKTGLSAHYPYPVRAR
jgi:hypothetical protein